MLILLPLSEMTIVHMHIEKYINNVSRYRKFYFVYAGEGGISCELPFLCSSQ